VCARCGGPIAGTVADPLVWTSPGKFHFACFQLEHAEAYEREEKRRIAARERRAEAGRFLAAVNKSKKERTP
jgi:hypothetical protein